MVETNAETQDHQEAHRSQINSKTNKGSIEKSGNEILKAPYP